MPVAAEGGTNMALESDQAQGDESTRCLATRETLSAAQDTIIDTPPEQIDEDQLDKVRAAIALGGNGHDSLSLEETKGDNGVSEITLAALPDLADLNRRATPPATQRGRRPYILLDVLPKAIKDSYKTMKSDSRASTSKHQTTKKRKTVQSHRPASRGSSRSSDYEHADGNGHALYKVDSLFDDRQGEDEDEMHSDGEAVLRSRVPKSGIARSRNKRSGAHVKYAAEQPFESESSSEPLGGGRGRAIVVRSSSSRSTSEEVMATPRKARIGLGKLRKRKLVDSGSEHEARLEMSDGLASGRRRRTTSPMEVAWSQRHREYCDKCDLLPADEILALALAKAQKRKGRPPKRRKDDDAIPDEELAEILGGWVECERCTLASHWDCVGAKQKRQILDKAVPGTKDFGLSERTTMICARCSINSACFVCKAEHVIPQIESATLIPAGSGDEISQAASSTTTKPNLNGPEGISDNVSVLQRPEKKDDIVDNNATMGLEPSVLDRSVDAPGGLADRPALTSELAAVEPSGDVDMASEETRSRQGQAGSGSGAEVAEALLEDEKVDKVAGSSSEPLFFRCRRCKRSAHYQHMHNPFSRGATNDELAEYYQEDVRSWECHQCRDWPWPVDKIIAWRPEAADAVEPKRRPDEVPHWKDPLPREYLVKFQDRGFRHVTWVPHSWLVVVSGVKLRNFLEFGPSLDLITNETLAAKGDDMDTPSISAILEEEDRARARVGVIPNSSLQKSPLPDPDAVESVPMAWKTVDRILDVFLQPPNAKEIAKINKRKKGKKSKVTRGQVIQSDSDDDKAVSIDLDGSLPTIIDGMAPDEANMIEIATWEELLGVHVTEQDADKLVKRVTWCFVKWDDLQYDQSCWDTAPPQDSPLWPAFAAAFKAYLRSRTITIPVLSTALAKKRDSAAATIFKPFKDQPKCIVGGQLMPFQLEGLQWLVYKHSLRQSCILADDMGLGKTIQIAALLGYLGSSQFSIFPSLVIVPNSTITNWVREFEKWVPHMRVVPFFGESASRKVVLKYELYHKGLQGQASALKAHVVLTTYDMITSQDFKIFKSIPRWEMLIVDEGQRLKSDSSKIFKQLKTLNTVHRILLTGTPLNNNLRELFNLLNFLDEANFKDLADLEERFQNLDHANVQELHAMIKPYILRRVKADVLKLPPKSEIIVPISLRPLQKQLYKGVLEKNADLLEAILAGKRSLGKKKVP